LNTEYFLYFTKRHKKVQLSKFQLEPRLCACDGGIYLRHFVNLASWQVEFEISVMGALLSIPFLAVPGITGMGGWILSCCGAAAVQNSFHPCPLTTVHCFVQTMWIMYL
jgi:hypothetical protein